MNKYIFTLYRIVVPKPIRTIILKSTLRRKILKYFSMLPESEINSEQKKVLEYLEKNEIRIFPYPFHSDYSPDQIEVFIDKDLKMRYVLLDGKKLYFKKRWSEEKIRKSYCDLMREQDAESPHRYLTNAFSVVSSDVVADIGAAEGNFSLSVVETARKIYLFEYDPEWIEALKATFAPWKDKVEIINKYMSDHDDDSHIKFDTLYKNKKDINFLKIDVDGAESVVLSSCSEAFKSDQPFKIALCTYHKNEDEKAFTELLKDNGFSLSPSNGYMINYYDKKMKAPYLRRGLIRAVRS